MTLVRFFTSALVAGLIGSSPMSHAAVDNVVYINGINTTLGEMLVDRNYARSALNPENSSNIRTFSVSYVHNPIGWFNVNNAEAASQDRKELFLLKTAEECFTADFERIIVPHNQSRTVDKSAAARVSAYLHNIVPGRKGGHSCGANSLSDPADGVTAAEMSATRTAAFRLSEKIRSYRRVIVVAHSQGNLLANLAYAHVVSLVGDEASRLVRIVNVANNARFRASGLEISHANDLALAGLELLGQSYIRTTPRCADERCNFRLAGATLEGVSVAGDTYNHGFVRTYLSSYPVAVSNAQGVTFTSNTRSFRERFVDFVYTAAASLDVTGRPVEYTEAASGDLPEFGIASPPWFTPFTLRVGRNTIAGRMTLNHNTGVFDFDSVSFYIPSGLRLTSATFELTANEIPRVGMTLLRRDPLPGFPYWTQSTILVDSFSAETLSVTWTMPSSILPLEGLGSNSHYILGVGSIGSNKSPPGNILDATHRLTLVVESAN